MQKEVTDEMLSSVRDTVIPAIYDYSWKDNKEFKNYSGEFPFFLNSDSCDLQFYVESYPEADKYPMKCIDNGFNYLEIQDQK